MTKKEIKILCIVTLIFLILIIVSYFVFSGAEKEANFLNGNIIVDGNRFLKYENGDWINLNTIDYDIEMNEFKVYSNNSYIGEYSVTLSDDKFYFFDSDYKSHHISSPFLAINKDSNLSLIDYKESSFSYEDDNIISTYLKSNDIDYSGDYSIKNKYVLDLNNDEKLDYIYVLCNELYSDSIFYVIFAFVDNTFITINKQIEVNELEKYELKWVLNSDFEGNNDIILGLPIIEMYDYYLYRYNGNKMYEEILREE